MLKDESQMKDQIQEVPIQNYILPQTTDQGKKSSYLEEYKQILHLSRIDELDEDQLIYKFHSNGIIFNSKYFQQNISITVEEYSNNYEAIKVNVKYGSFSQSLNLINIDSPSPFKQFEKVYVGTYGIVYKYFDDKIPVAIKCIKINQNNFEIQLKQTIKEYLFLSIASSLKIGPCLVKTFGFDIVIFRDSFIFCMEFCNVGQYDRKCKEVLSRKLHLLHLLKIVHMDIKPNNIAFSFYFNEYVFIDFGLSRMVVQPIGCHTLTRFCGSMNFCSSNMLDLFMKDEPRFLDLYYNDAFCLNQTINSLKCEQKPTDEQLWTEQRSNTIINYYQEVNSLKLLLNTKQIFFEAFCNRFFEQFRVRKYIVFMRQKQESLMNFILNLPQSIHLMQYFKEHFLQDEKKSQIYPKNSFYDEESLQFLTERYSEFIRVSDESQKFHNTYRNPEAIQESILLKNKIVKTLKKEVYILALIKFIKINSPNKRFSQKIQACIICNEIFQFSTTKNLNQTQIYKLTVKFIFENVISMEGRTALQILKNAVETIVILQIVTEQQFFMAFIKVLSIKAPFIQIMCVIFEFITALQYGKQKYRRKYDYNNFLQKMLKLLDNYLNQCASNIKKPNEIIIYNKFKFITTMSSNNLDYQKALKNIHQQSATFVERRINEALIVYLLFEIIINNMVRRQFCRIQEMDVLYIIMNNYNRNQHFSYTDFLILKFGQLSNQHSEIFKIYSKFYEQLQYFEQHKYFNLYPYHQIMVIKDQLFNQASNKEVIFSTQQSNYFEELFSIYDFIIKNNIDFYKQIGFLLLNNPSFIHNPKIFPHIKKLIMTNKEKITKISNKYHKQIKHIPNQSPMFQVMVISNVFQFMSLYISEGNQVWEIRLKNFLQQCSNIIQGSECFECKVSTLIYVSQICANYLIYQQKIQESFSLFLQLLALHYKNNQLLPNAFNIIAPMIRVWCSFQYLLRKYDLQGILYDFIKYEGSPDKNYRYCLMDIVEYNIFLRLYIHLFLLYAKDYFIEFIVNVAKSIPYVLSQSAINLFYFSIFQIIYLQQENDEKMQLFLNFHSETIDQIISLTQKSNVPYIALYLHALLGLQLQKDRKVRMMKAICRSILHLDNYSQSLILSTYYQIFAQINKPIEKRKQGYLRWLQLKYTSQELTQTMILKTQARYFPKDLCHHMKKIKIVEKIKVYYLQTMNVIKQH